MDDNARDQDRLEGIAYTTDTVQELLAGVRFPIARDALVRYLEKRGAPLPVVEHLRTAEAEEFGGIEEVMDVVGGFAV